MTRKVHLDTDLGGNIDDLCALVLLLRWEEHGWICVPNPPGISRVGQ